MTEIDYSKEKKPYGFIYITTDDTNNKRYIGQRRVTNKIDDDNYLGSGTRLWNAIRKRGKEHFHKEIIEECWSLQELNDRERYWIKFYNAQESDEFYNIAEGGDFGDVWKGLDQETKDKIAREARERNLNREYDPKWFLYGKDNGAYGRHWYKDESNHKQYYLYEDDPLIEQLHLIKGMYRTQDHNIKIGLSNKGISKPSHQKGKICLTDGNHNIFCNSDDVQMWIDKGYRMGCKSIRPVCKGKIKVNNGEICKTINPNELDEYLSKGFVKGVLPSSRQKRKRRTKKELMEAKINKLKTLGINPLTVDLNTIKV